MDLVFIQLAVKMADEGRDGKAALPVVVEKWEVLAEWFWWKIAEKYFTINLTKCIRLFYNFKNENN